MPKDKNFFFLQPNSDQAFGLARILRHRSDLRMVAVLLQHEKETKALRQVYASIIRVNDYSEITNGVVIPFGATSTGTLLEKKDIILFDVTMRQSALSVYQKDSFIALCNTYNLPCPETFVKEDEIDSSKYPIFYKQKYEQGGGVRGIAHTRADLPTNNKESLIYQEFIDTKGTYGVGFIANEGVVEISFSHFESVSYPASGGSAVQIEAFNSSRLLELTSKFVEISGYSGWGLAEYKWCDKRNDFVFMEINAKLWASCEFSFRNEPGFLIKLFGVKLEKENITSMVFLNRAFNAGPVSGLKAILKKNGKEKVIYPGFLRSIILGFMPDAVLPRITAIIKNIKS